MNDLSASERAHLTAPHDLLDQIDVSLAFRGREATVTFDVFGHYVPGNPQTQYDEGQRAGFVIDRVTLSGRDITSALPDNLFEQLSSCIQEES